VFSCRALAVTVMPTFAGGAGDLSRAEVCEEDSCSDATCVADTCADSTCEADTCVDSTCPDDTACEGSSCPSDTCDAGTCQDASFCDGDTCLGGPTCAGSTCPGGDSCEDATCGGGPSCSGDSCLGDSCPGDSCHGSSEIGPCFAATEPCLNTGECAATSHCDHTFLIIEPPPDDAAQLDEDVIAEPEEAADEDEGWRDAGARAIDDLTLRSLHAQLEELLSAHS
jgi:hypothetical protein